MILFWIALVVCLFVGCRRRKAGEDFMDRSQTTAINGLFIGWVFLRHVCDYFTTGGPLDRAFGVVEFAACQLIVATFLFFSGYGVMEQIKKKGAGYVATFPKKRILKVLVDFDVAVMLFVVAGLLLGKSFTARQIGLSLVGWDDVGNSNWYIFLILICYAVTFLVFKFGNLRGPAPLHCAGGKAVAWVTVPLLAICFALFFFKDGYWWWDTLLAYAAGMAYSQYRTAIDARLSRHWWLWLAVFVVGHGVWRGLAKAVGLDCPARVVFLNLRTIFFAMAVVTVMMRFRFGNRVVNFLGAHLFPIYIYQRLVMMLVLALCGKELVADWRYAYVIVCAIGTCGIAVLYEKGRKLRVEG